MRTVRSIPLAVAAIVPAWLAAAPAEACTLLPVICVGGPECHPTEAERRANERRWSVEETRRRLALLEARRRAGPVDFAAELADMLVPNVRPTFAYQTSCGWEGDGDPSDGRETDASLFERLTAGTAAAGADPSDHPALFRRGEENSFGKPCNREFRRGFADLLRRSVAPEHLRQGWLFLGARQRSLQGRLVRFDDFRSRIPPVRWDLANDWLDGQAERATRLQPWGRSIDAAARGFGAEQASRLGDDMKVCPTAVAQWARLREEVVAEIVGREAARRARLGARH